MYGEILTTTIAEHNRLKDIKTQRVLNTVSNRQIVLNQVNDVCGQLITGMPTEVSEDDPYNNDTSRLLKARQTSLQAKKVKWHNVKVQGVSGRYAQGQNPNTMKAF